MKAIIFAAGLGTRIQEISKGRPKALIEINNKPLLQLAIEYLAKNGIDAIIVNVHHQSQLIIDFINHSNFSIPISISDETDLLLDTGGGLLKAKSFFDEEDFIAYNVDVLTNLNLEQIIAEHKRSAAIATLAIRNRATSRHLLFDKDFRMIGWENSSTKEKIVHRSEAGFPFAFSGIQVLSPKIFKLINRNVLEPFSITKSYIELSKDYLIKGFLHDDNYWFDVGKPDTYQKACEFLK